MAEHLTYVARTKPTGVSEHDREPRLYVRWVPQRTAAAMLRRGLVEAIYMDYPAGGYRGRLTALGLEAEADRCHRNADEFDGDAEECAERALLLGYDPDGGL